MRASLTGHQRLPVDNDVFPLPSPNVSIRQLFGRPGEVWGGESGADKLVVVKRKE